MIIFTAFKLCCCQCHFYTHQNTDSGVPVHTGKGKREPYWNSSGLVLLFTKSTTINFQNTVTTAQVHLLPSYYSWTFFQCNILCLDFLLRSMLCSEFWITNNWWHYSSCYRNKTGLSLFILWHHLEVLLINQSSFYTFQRRTRAEDCLLHWWGF